MKVVIGKPTDKNIEDIISTNALYGHTIYFDGKEYYCEVLNHGNLYVAPDVQFYSIPDGLYVYKDKIPYLVEE